VTPATAASKAILGRNGPSGALRSADGKIEVKPPIVPRYAETLLLEDSKPFKGVRKEH